MAIFRRAVLCGVEEWRYWSRFWMGCAVIDALKTIESLLQAKPVGLPEARF